LSRTQLALTESSLIIF